VQLPTEPLVFSNEELQFLWENRPPSPWPFEALPNQQHPVPITNVTSTAVAAAADAAAAAAAAAASAAAAPTAAPQQVSYSALPEGLLAPLKPRAQSPEEASVLIKPVAQLSTQAKKRSCGEKRLEVSNLEKLMINQ